MACYPCIHCNKCGMFSVQSISVCAECGTEMQPGIAACPNCGCTSTTVVKKEISKEDE